MRSRHRGLIGVCAVALAGTTLAGVPSAATADDAVLPVLGQASTRPADGDPTQELVVSVHGVRRAYGATIVYWSAGFKAGATGLDGTSLTEAVGTDKAFGRGTYADPVGSVAVTDPVGLKAYGPLTVEDMSLAAPKGVGAEFATPGKAHAFYAALPQLPPSTRTVDVHVGGLDFPAVPVQDGPMLPERPADQPVVVGTGWPKPDAARIRQDTTPERSVHPMQQNVANLDATVTERKGAARSSVDVSADVLFAVDQATITPRGQASLQQAAGSLRSSGAQGAVEVSGHTDSNGSDAHNLDLSRRRAEAAAAALRPMLPPGITLTTVGRGRTQPIASNDTDSGRQANRRIALSYTPKAGQ